LARPSQLRCSAVEYQRFLTQVLFTGQFDADSQSTSLTPYAERSRPTGLLPVLVPVHSGLRLFRETVYAACGQISLVTVPVVLPSTNFTDPTTIGRGLLYPDGCGLAVPLLRPIAFLQFSFYAGRRTAVRNLLPAGQSGCIPRVDPSPVFLRRA